MNEIYGDIRNMLVRGEVVAVNDTGALQTITVRTHADYLRGDIEVAMPFGVSSVPPVGAVALLAAVGGDPADLMAVALYHPGARLGGLAAGEVAIYDHGGNRVAVRAGGQVEVVAATSATVTVGGTTVTVGADGVTINGTLTVSGPIHGTADHAVTSGAVGL